MKKENKDLSLIKSFFKKHEYLLLTIISSLIVIIAIFILQGLAPFGDKSMLTIDFFHQYAPMLGELYDRVKNGSSLIYSFNTGMGLPFFRNFFNYLSSPFNILIFLFKRIHLLTSYSIIIGLKSICSCITMSIFLKNKFNKDYKMFIPISLLYGFCAYFVAYYWNIMWLDGMVLLPLITLGIEYIINKENPFLYIVSLVIMLFANYFIAYMICIFSVLYFLTYLFIKTNKFDFKKIGKKCLIFGVASLIAGGICAVFLIPMFKSMSGISATGDVWPTSQYYDFTFIEFIYNHLSGVGSTVLKSGVTTAPNVSCGILSVMLLFAFYFNSDIKLKVKFAYTLLLLIMILSFVLAPLDYIWHAFHVPNDLPYRYSFLYSFVLIIISAYSLFKIKGLKSIYGFVCYGLALIFISLVWFLPFENISRDMIYLNYGLSTIFFLLFVIYKYFGSYKKIVPYICIVTVMLECCVVLNNNWDIAHVASTFYSDYDSMRKGIDFVNKNDKEMHRMERIDLLTYNDPSWYNYYGQMTFSSMAYENMAVINHALGMPGNEINSYYYKSNTPIYDMLFNVKYIIGDINDFIHYSLYFDSNDLAIYKSKYNLGLMFGVNNNIKNWNTNYDNPFNNQNDFVLKSSGIDNVLKELSIYKKELYYEDDNHKIFKYSVKNDSNNFYLYFNNYLCDFMVINGSMYYNENEHDYVYNSDLTIYSNSSYSENYIIDALGENNNLEFYVGYTNYYDDEDIWIYSLDENKFNEAYTYYLNNKVSIEEFNEDKITAFGSFNKDMSVFTSIPYDKGWNVYIDGIKVNTYEINNTLLGFDVEAGEHNIVIKYKIPYALVGGCISLLSLSLLGFWIYTNKKSLKNKF